MGFSIPSAATVTDGAARDDDRAAPVKAAFTVTDARDPNGQRGLAAMPETETPRTG